MSHFALPTVCASGKKLMTQHCITDPRSWETFVYIDLGDVFEPNGSMGMCDDSAMHDYYVYMFL